MSLDLYNEEFAKYTKFAGSIEVEQWLRWTGVAHLSRFVENLHHVEREDRNFSSLAAQHKLEVLKNLEAGWKSSKNLTSDFLDVYMGMYNIGLVDGGKVIRASQPSVGDIAWFAGNMNARALINLRNDAEYWEGYNMENEKEACKDNMLEYFHFPLEDLDDFPPTKEKIEEVLQKIDYFAKPVVFHCSEGKSLTGVVAAAYRLSRLDFTWEEALEEALYYGFDPHMNPKMTLLMKSFAKK